MLQDEKTQDWKLQDIGAAMRYLLFPGLLACLTALRFCAGLHTQAPDLPRLTASVIGPKELVFDTRNGCEKIDIPDAPARAFRDSNNIVHLVAAHFVARAMIGPSLDRLTHDCHVIYRSPQDPDPSHFQDNNWLYSFYSIDGRRIAALVHSEYDADEIPGMCATPEDSGNCWWNTVTYAESRDGGYTFQVPPSPRNLIAALPYRYLVGNRDSSYGYYAPTNIQTIGGFRYALVNDASYKAQKGGPCLIRTSNVYDPSSWRAWDGRDFSVRFADPYRETILKPEEHVCMPVLEGFADSLVKHDSSGIFIVTQFGQFSPDGAPPGLYLQDSRDLVHWSKPILLVKVSDLLGTEGPGKWRYSYISLLDPASTDRNFATVSDTPYVYYVRFDEGPPYARSLFRRQIRIQFGQPAQEK